MTYEFRSSLWLSVILLGFLGIQTAPAQIDPEKRELFQFGYNAAFEGHAPLSLYAYYYHNEPDFLQRTNFTLRLAIAPTYADAELGIESFFGPDTHLGIGAAGGGYADSYFEIQNGRYTKAESFDGFGGQTSLALYHLFNPGSQIPLNGVVRGIARYTTYAPTDDTADNFNVPDPTGILGVRTGLRWGGREPTLFPALAMELSIWSESEFRTDPGVYGYGDRQINQQSHTFWTEAFLAYEIARWKHNFSLSITAGTSIDADRLSAYRLGGFLPMVAEYPLSIPGYYYQELTAKSFVLFSGNYLIPLEPTHRWNLEFAASSAMIDWLDGLEESGQWRSGIGGGIFYTTRTWRLLVGYGYGIDAMRSHGRGAHTVGILLQFDLAPAKEAYFRVDSPGRWRGLQRVLGVLTN